jgi:predicted enzyme related to lactoylglutathione lyase
MNEHGKINYVEFPARDIAATKAFFEQAFDGSFDDFGTDYTAFSGAGLDVGFYRSELRSATDHGAALIVFYSADLEGTRDRIDSAGGTLSKPVFDFPGGRRFHFIEPSGNEFAVWSD